MYIIVNIKKISNKKREITAVILIVNIVLVYDIEIVRRYKDMKYVSIYMIFVKSTKYANILVF